MQHPMILPPVAQRESYTQQVSLKIGISLEQKFTDIARQRNTHINNVYREALVKYTSVPDNTQDVTVLTQRIQQLEAENSTLREFAVSVPSPAQVAYDAFANETVIAAIRDIAERIENADIDYSAEAVLQQFISHIPQLP